MTTLSAAVTAVMAEINAVLLIIFGGLLFIHLRNKKRDTAAVTALVTAVKKNEPAQTQALVTALKEQYGHDDENALENAKKLLKLKKGFYKQLIQIYLNNHSEAFLTLDKTLDELLMSYRSLMPVAGGQSPQEAGAAPPDDVPAALGDAPSTVERIDTVTADVDELKKQNEQLRQQLEQAKKELESTIAEYVSAYSGGAELGKAKLSNEMHKLEEKRKKGLLEEEHEQTEPAAKTAAGLDLPLPPGVQSGKPADNGGAVKPAAAAAPAPPDSAAAPVHEAEGAEDNEIVMALGEAPDEAMAENAAELHTEEN